VKTIEDYVPSFLPNKYCDGLTLEIAADGKVSNMQPDSDDLRQLARLIDGMELAD
jgi:hypothetical protein